jgi:hypothetical protein
MAFAYRKRQFHKAAWEFRQQMEKDYDWEHYPFICAASL